VYGVGRAECCEPGVVVPDRPPAAVGQALCPATSEAVVDPVARLSEDADLGAGSGHLLAVEQPRKTVDARR